MVNFYEIDGGPSGMWWEAHGERGWFQTYYNTVDMIAAAKAIHQSGGQYRIHTQEEYNLRWEIEEADLDLVN